MRLHLDGSVFATITNKMFYSTVKSQGRLTQADQAMSRSTFKNAKRETPLIEHIWFPAYQDGGRIDAAKADVFGLGCMMLELISGEHPFPEIHMLANKGFAQDFMLAYPLIPRFRLQPKRCFKQIPNDVGAVFTAACEMLNPDPDKRVSAAAASLHPWIIEAQQAMH